MNLNFGKYSDGLIPAIVQDVSTRQVLMLGFMNEEAIAATRQTGFVTFFSRSKKRLWTKGETSGNRLELVSITADCDLDTLLVKARPIGPVCHQGADTCFGEENLRNGSGIFEELEDVIRQRRSNPSDESYVAKLFAKGINKIAQKVGEEAVETVIAAKDDDGDALKNEAADLIFHLLVLLNARGSSLAEVAGVLRNRRTI